MSVLIKRLDFNKGWNDLGYLGVKHIENESWVDMSWIFHIMGWSVYGLKRLATNWSTVTDSIMPGLKMSTRKSTLKITIVELNI